MSCHTIWLFHICLVKISFHKGSPPCRLALLPSRTAFRRDAHRPGEYMDTKKTSKDYDKLSQIFQKQYRWVLLIRFFIL